MFVLLFFLSITIACGETEVSENVTSTSAIASFCLAFSSKQECMKDGQYSNLHFTNVFKDPCERDLHRVMAQPYEKPFLLMLDADAKTPPGVKKGNVAWIGAHKQCIEVYVPTDSKSKEADSSFRGQYCTLRWNIEGSMIQRTLSLCVPDTCKQMNTTLFQQILNDRKILADSEILKNISKPENKASVYCHPKTAEFSDYNYAFIFLLLINAVLLISGTLITIGRNLWERIIGICTWEGSIPDFFKCFCMITNFDKILEITPPDPNDFPFMNGIRVLSLSWVIFGHTYTSALESGVYGNAFDFFRVLNNEASQIILQATYAVELFFIMSGFLLVKGLYKHNLMEASVMQWLTFFCHRYIRLAAVYVITYVFYRTLAPHLISGPFKSDVIEPNCLNWWSSMFFLNNFYQSQCLNWTWYLANDMQFYIVCSVAFCALLKVNALKAGTAFFVFLSLCITFSLCYLGEIFLPYKRIPQREQLDEYLAKIGTQYEYVYVKPYNRIIPYIIGMALGKYHGDETQIPISKRMEASLWIGTVACVSFLVFGSLNNDYSNLVNSLMNTFSRPIFAFFMAWVMYCCLNQRCDLLNRLLSHPVFLLLGKVTFSTYLVHPIIMHLYFRNLPKWIMMSHFQMVFHFYGFMIVSFGAGLLIKITFESPFLAMEKFFKAHKEQFRNFVYSVYILSIVNLFILINFALSK